MITTERYTIPGSGGQTGERFVISLITEQPVTSRFTGITFGQTGYQQHSNPATQQNITFNVSWTVPAEDDFLGGTITYTDAAGLQTISIPSTAAGTFTTTAAIAFDRTIRFDLVLRANDVNGNMIPNGVSTFSLNASETEIPQLPAPTRGAPGGGLQSPSGELNNFMIEQFDAGTIPFTVPIPGDMAPLTYVPDSLTVVDHNGNTLTRQSDGTYILTVAADDTNPFITITADYLNPTTGDTVTTAPRTVTFTTIRSLRWGTIALADDTPLADSQLTLEDVRMLQEFTRETQTTLDDGTVINVSVDSMLDYGTRNPDGQIVTFNGFDNDPAAFGQGWNTVRMYMVWSNEFGELSSLRNVDFNPDNFAGEFMEITGITGYRVYMTGNRSGFRGATRYTITTSQYGN